MLSLFHLLLDLFALFDFLRNILPFAKYPNEPWYWRWGGLVLLLLTIGTGCGGLAGSHACTTASFAGAIVLLIVIGIRTLLIEERKNFKD